MGADPVSFLTGNGASYLRIASIAVAAYDYFLTLPSEYRFYKGQRSWRLSPGCILFILIRYLSVLTIVISNVGYFGTFSSGECQRYYIAAPVFKVLQTMVSQIILGVRAYNISRRTRWVMWLLLILYFLVSPMEFFTNLWERVPVQNDEKNCTPGNSSAHLSVWLYYVLAMFYDVTTLAISSYFLIGLSNALNNNYRHNTPFVLHQQLLASFRRMSGLVQLMFYDGLGYFLVLTAANVLNLILYRAADEAYQSSGASVGYAVTWIMSQRILIHLRDAAAEHQATNFVVTQQLHSGRDITRAMRSNLDGSDHKGRFHDEFQMKKGHKNADLESVSENGLTDVDLDVQVQVEHTVAVDYIPPPSQAYIAR